MFYVYLISLILIAVTFVLFWITRARIDIRSRRPVVIASTALLLIGLIMTWYGGDLVSSGLIKQQWPVIQAEIIESKVVGEKRAFRPQVTYRFNLDSTEYQRTTDLHISGFGNKRARRDNARRIAAEFPVRQMITVHYNQDNPAESSLRTGPFWSDYMKLVLGCLMFCGGLYLLLALIFRHGNKKLPA